MPSNQIHAVARPQGPGEVMNADNLGLITPDATGVFEIPDEFLLFGIDTNDGFMPAGEGFPHPTDMTKLLIPFLALLEGAVAAERDSFAIGLEGISQFLEHRADPFIADQDAFSLEFSGDFSGGLAGPFESGHGVARSFVFHQRADAINDLRSFF